MADKFSFESTNWGALVFFLNVSENESDALGIARGLWFNVMCLPFIIRACVGRVSANARDFIRDSKLCKYGMAKLQWSSVISVYPIAPQHLKRGTYYITTRALMYLSSKKVGEDYFAAIGKSSEAAFEELKTVFYS